MAAELWTVAAADACPRVPLTVATGFAAGYWLLPGMSVWVVAMLAAALAATDAALAAPVIMDDRIPHQLRRIIDVESGLNDGLATPLVLLPGRRRGQRRPSRGRGTVGSRTGRACRRHGRRCSARWRTTARVREADALEQRRGGTARHPDPCRCSPTSPRWPSPGTGSSPRLWRVLPLAPWAERRSPRSGCS